MKTRRELERVETHKIGGVSFEIRLSRLASRIQVEWHCGICRRRASARVPGRSLEAALRSVRSICEAHQRELHHSKGR